MGDIDTDHWTDSACRGCICGAGGDLDPIGRKAGSLTRSRVLSDQWIGM